MQAELDEQNPAIEIQILGVNEFGYESGNDSMSGDRVLPWLQPAQTRTFGRCGMSHIEMSLFSIRSMNDSLCSI